MAAAAVAAPCSHCSCFSVAQLLRAAELVIVQSQRQIIKASTKRQEIKMGECAESKKTVCVCECGCVGVGGGVVLLF